VGIDDTKAVVALLEELCVDLGLCLSGDDRQMIIDTEWETADDLTDAVFRAEGMESPFDLRLWRDVRSRARAQLSWGSA
jgi:hypothetical protein